MLVECTYTNSTAQLTSSNEKVASSINITTLKQIISHSFDILTSKKMAGSVDVSQTEFYAIYEAIVHHFECQMMCEEPEQMDEFEGQVNINMDPTSWKKLKEILNVYFPVTAQDDCTADIITELTEAIKTQLKEHHLQDIPLFNEKVLIDCLFLLNCYEI